MHVAKQILIEFYGNSITCGYAIKDKSSNDSWNGYFENNYLTYAAITARHFNAEYSCIGKSGNGVMVSWFPLIMPEMYNGIASDDPSSHWDFSRWPDVMMINLFQNDSWLIKPEHEQLKARFGSKAPDSSMIRRIPKLRGNDPQQVSNGNHYLCAGHYGCYP